VAREFERAMNERGRLDLSVEALVIGPIVAPFLLAVTNVSLKRGGLRRLDA
jgi:hypothetical protein